MYSHSYNLTAHGHELKERFVELVVYLLEKKREFTISRQLERAVLELVVLPGRIENADCNMNFYRHNSVALQKAKEVDYWLSPLVRFGYLKHGLKDGLHNEYIYLMEQIAESGNIANAYKVSKRGRVKRNYCYYCRKKELIFKIFVARVEWLNLKNYPTIKSPYMRLRTGK